jgi:N-acetyl-gamma-glutamyl-phosphate reductase
MKMRANIAGASGYAGGELLRLLADHPGFEVGVSAASSNAGELITHLHPALQSYAGARFVAHDDSALGECDILFTALPHGASAALVKMHPSIAKVVDLGADFRLTSASAWQEFYGGDHAGTWVYGLPEMLGARALIKESSRIANPGCYATAISLGIAPLLSAGLVESDGIVVVAASGTSGAGRAAKVNLLGSEVMGSMTAYKVGGTHQHTPEIEQTLSYISGKPVTLTFTPFLAPMSRGILAAITLKMTGKHDVSVLRKAFTHVYSKEEFVHMVDAQPATASVYGSNNVHIAVESHIRVGHAVVTVALDNLVKGAAGQAIQNANIMYGFAENSGLTGQGIAP